MSRLKVTNFFEVGVAAMVRQLGTPSPDACEIQNVEALAGQPAARAKVWPLS